MSLNSASKFTNQDTNLSNFGLMLNPVRNLDDQGTSESVSSISSIGDINQWTNFDSTTGLFSQNRTPLLRHLRLFKALSGPSSELSSPSATTGNENINVRSLTTFSGVFTPVSLSMFSAILFLRLGYILGNSGLLYTILQMILAYVILFFTVLSVCAISTNGAIEGGGAYFMISRALGPEFGGSIGTLFFIANILSSALYLTGSVEGVLTSFGPDGSIAKILPGGRWFSFFYGSSLNVLNMLVCFVGASLFGKTSVFIFIIVMFSAVSVIISLIAQKPLSIPIPDDNHYLNHTTDMLNFTGFDSNTFLSNIYPSFTRDYTTDSISTFSIVFGVLFSGVTGIMAGANMSGELKDPGKSIPKGTLGAVSFTFVTYLIFFLMTAATCPHNTLINNYHYMQYINYFPPFVAIGIFAATFFAALSNLIGASRVLEALAKDNLFGSLLEPIVKLSRNGNPFFAVIISWFIIQCILIIGSLNLIAQITSVFFLLSYFSTNLACLALTLTSAPNFRPSFRYFSFWTTLIAMFGCLSMMFVINPLYAAIAVTMCLLLVIMLHIRSPPVRWGSISQALIFHQVRKYLLLLDSRKDHIKYWRPQFLLMVANPRSCIPLITFVNDLKKSGLYVLGHIKVGNLNEYQVDPVVAEYHLWLKLLDKLKVKAFVEVTMCESVRDGLHQLSRLTGLGAMKPNTILFGFYDDAPPIDFFSKDSRYEALNQVICGDDVFLSLRNETKDKKNISPDEYVLMIYDCILKLQKNVVIARHFHLLDKSSITQSKDAFFIDIWPINFFSPYESIDKIDNCWLFMMQLGCVLHMVLDWKKNTMVRVFACVDSKKKESGLIRTQWDQMLHMLRIEASINVVFLDYHLQSVDNLFNIQPGNESVNSKFESTSNQSSVNFDLSKSKNIQANFTPNENYLIEINQMIKDHCDKTAVVFMYLPPPKMIDNVIDYNYLHQLNLLTSNLPPTLLVYGISPVISTTL